MIIRTPAKSGGSKTWPRFSIHFDPAFPERKGSFQYTDRMDPPENMRGKIDFFGKDLPVIPGATLTFTDDIDALRAGKPGMTVALDSDSDGQPELSVQIAPGPLNPNGSRGAELKPGMPEFEELFEAEAIN